MSYSSDSTNTSSFDVEPFLEIMTSETETELSTDDENDSYSGSSGNESSVIIESHVDDDDDDDDDYFDDDDSEIEYTIERIFREESDYIDTDKESGKYYIGLYKYNSFRKIFVLTNAISAKSFLKFSYKDTLKYLYIYSIMRTSNPKIEIFSLIKLPDDSYSVILKTHWLRIIQRNWKLIFKERAEILLKRRSVKSLYNLQITGRYPYGLNSMPSIHGMLWNLNKKYISYRNKNNNKNKNTSESDIIIDMEIQDISLFIKSQ